MIIRHLHTLGEVADFLQGSRSLEPMDATQVARYQWIEHTLRHFQYARLGKPDKGLLIAYLCAITGYSRQKITRLIRRYRDQGRLRWDMRPTAGFTGRYTDVDIRLLAEIDALHDAPSGPAVKKLCERARRFFDDARYARLAGISVAHLYNLRATPAYRGRRRHYQKTRPVTQPIGVRGKPDPQGAPGFIRIDTVHQGDADGVKGLYSINVVDEVTQFESVFTVARISEQFLTPALARLLESFPFVIRGFHADSGSEYINRHVAELLEKLHIELTQSRPHHCNDNALAESKNAAVVRKILGYVHIPQRFAAQVNRFNGEHLKPYVNYHRPCFLRRRSSTPRTNSANATAMSR